MTAPASWLRGRRCAEERGTYAVFVAVIAVGIVFFSAVAYELPRLVAARQQVAHVANEAARVSAATIAAGGSAEDARGVANETAARALRAAGFGDSLTATIDDDGFECVGSRVQVTVRATYVYRSMLRVARPHQRMAAKGAAQSLLLSPSGEALTTHFVGECPLPAAGSP